MQLNKVQEPAWVEPARILRAFHGRKLRETGGKWRVADTARENQCSMGYVSEALLIARWLLSHERDMIQIDKRDDVLKWIRTKKREIDARED